MDKEKQLLSIAQEIEKCPLCRKGGTGKSVPGEGNADADIVFIGEAPGREEAKLGRPFIGRSGRLLRKAIQGIGLKEEEVFITSPVKYLPVHGTPSRESILHGREHLLKQLSIIGPQVVVLLGNVACAALIGERVRISKEHGRVIRREGRIYFVTYHPAYALRFPAGKEEFLKDFQTLRRLTIRSRKE